MTNSKGMMISKEGKEILVEEFYKMLEKKSKYNGRNVTNIDKIQLECHNFASFLLDEVS